MKKKLFTLATLVAIAAPITTVISCSSSHEDLNSLVNTKQKQIVNVPTPVEIIEPPKQEVKTPPLWPHAIPQMIPNKVKIESPSTPDEHPVPAIEFSKTLRKSFTKNSTKWRIQYSNHYANVIDGEFEITYKEYAGNPIRKDYLILYKKYNRVWLVEIDSSNDNYIKKELANYIFKIKNDREYNVPTIHENITSVEQEDYIGYIYKRYNADVWPKMYSDFSILKEKFPFINVEYNHYNKGSWNTNLFHSETMWNAFAKSPEEEGKVDKEAIKNKTDIDVYKIMIDSHPYLVIFDSKWGIPNYMQVKLITDLLIYKQWSHQILLQEGMMIAGEYNDDGMAHFNGVNVHPNGKYFKIINTFLPNKYAAMDFYSISKTLDVMMHEFGHTTTAGAKNMDKFINGELNIDEAKEVSKFFNDEQRFEKIKEHLNDVYGSLMVKVGDYYNQWNANPFIESETTASFDGRFQEYAFKDEYEFATEISRMINSPSFFENTKFMDASKSFASSEVTRYLSYFDAYGIPLQKKDSMELTKLGKSYRDSFRKNILGYSNSSHVQVNDICTAQTNFDEQFCFAGSIAGGFDFVQVTDKSANKIQDITNIEKLGSNHSNWFNTNYFSREVTKLDDTREAFVATFKDSESYFLNNDYIVNFYKDTNQNGVLDSEDQKTYQYIK